MHGLAITTPTVEPTRFRLQEGLMRLRRYLTAACLTFGMSTTSSLVHAQNSSALNFCNRSANWVGVVVGYHSTGVNDPPDHSVLTGPFVTDGWTKVDPGQCQ